MFNGKRKAVTFSYDDGVTQDIRLLEILNKYRLKSTFNINSELLGKSNTLNIEGKEISHRKVEPSDAAKIYKGHEIAVHTLTHPLLNNLPEGEIIRQVEKDRLNLSELAGYEVIGMAYPGGKPNYNSRVAQIIEDKTNVKYARTTICSFDFSPQRDLYEFHPSVYHLDYDILYSLTENFLSSDSDEDMIFYIWGHSYEFDIHNSWDKFEDFCRLISGKDDIFYGTNREILL